MSIENLPIDSNDDAIPSRAVRVWLPPGYNEGNARYPVIYFHDGQNMYRPGGVFGCWLAEDTAEQLMREQAVRAAILVAVENNPGDDGNARITEYQPPSDINPRAPHGVAGLGDRYAQFLIHQVKPAIDARYRTLPDRSNTLTAGSSMGGLISLWLGLHTNVFGHVGVFSPAFWTSPRFMHAVQSGKKKPGLRIYMDMGTQEAGNTSGDYWHDAVTVRDALLQQGWRDGEDLLWVPGEGDEHNEAAWARRLPTALRFLLAR